MHTTLQARSQLNRGAPVVTHHASRITLRSFRTPHSALRTGFTLLELLVVISIIGILAALATPVLKQFRPNYSASASRQLLDDLARARQLAIAQRTKVYMVFVPTNFWSDPAYSLNAAFAQKSPARSTNLWDKQLVGYALVSVGSLGDQPGSPTVRYLSDWRTLPQGAFIPYLKFAPTNTFLDFATNDANGVSWFAHRIRPFPRSNLIPFPTEDFPIYNLRLPYASLPYIGFDHMGRLLTARDEIIPLAKGSVSFARDRTTKAPLQAPPSVNEDPPGNSTNSTSYNLVCIDWLTGRARVQHQEVR